MKNNKLIAVTAGALAIAVVLGGCGSSQEPPQTEQELAQTELNSPAAAPTAPLRAATANTQASGAVVFKEHHLTDPGMNNMRICTLLVPEDWEIKGGASRTGGMLYNMPVLVDLVVTAPDGRSARFFPSLSFEFNHQSQGQKLQPLQTGNIYFPLPESPGAWIMDLTKLRPDPDVSNVKLIAEEDIPETTRMLRQRNSQRFQSVAQLNQTTAQMGFGSEFDTQATKVVLQYDKGGKTIEETIALTWQYEIMIKQNQVTQGSWSIMEMRSIGGPVGTNYVDDPALNAIFQSVRINPQWQAEMNKYWAQLAQIKHKGKMDAIRTAGKISQIQAEGASAVNDIMMKGWRANTATSDRVQANSVNAIHEQTVYQTAAGESVKLPSFYDYALTDGNGRYLLHNDALYDPNLDPALNTQQWQKIEVLR